jgi:D-alanyl-lipoteichoic acid biosynthesis protein DltD
MKQFILIYVIPLIVAVFITLTSALNTQINSYFFKAELVNKSIDTNYYFIDHYNQNVFYEDDFLNSNAHTENIFLLGSSELTNVSDAIPYRFISNQFDVKVKAVGHAGNQCLSIFSQLLAHQEKLRNAPVVIILSPSWFESKTSQGTPSAIFLEFNSQRFLNKIIQKREQTIYEAYLKKRLAAMFNEFNSPSLEVKLMYFQHQSSKSFFHQALYKPTIMTDEQLLSLRNHINPLKPLKNNSSIRKAITPELIKINWDSIFTSSKNQVLQNANSNNIGIANQYYDDFKNKKGHIQPVSESFNHELEDMKILVQFLKSKNAKASFIISPLNPFYYKNLKELNPTISRIEQCLQQNDFKYLNLFEADTTKYDKALLFDVMHLSDYGWHKVNKFIINHYHLCYEK